MIGAVAGEFHDGVLAAGIPGDPKTALGRYRGAVGNVVRQAGLAHAGMERVSPASLLIAAAVTVGLGLVEPLVEILAESRRGAPVRPLAAGAFVHQGDDRTACRIEPHAEGLVLQRVVRDGFRLTRRRERKGAVATGGNILGEEGLAGLAGTLHQAGAGPGQPVVDDQPRTRAAHGTGQRGEIGPEQRGRDGARGANVVGLVLPRAFEVLELFCRSLLERLAVDPDRCRTTPGVLVVEQGLFVGPRQFFRGIGNRNAPATELGVERLDDRHQRAGIARGLHAAGVGHAAVNPGVGRFAFHDRQVGLLGEDGVGELLHRTHADFRFGQLLRDLGEDRLDPLGLRRAGIVAGDDDRDPGLVRPVGRWQEVLADVPVGLAAPGPEGGRRAVDARVHRQHARAVRSFPPEDRRQVVDVTARPVAADVHELHAAVREACCQRARLRRHIGRLRAARQRQVVLARNRVGENIAPRQFLRF